MAQNDPFWAIFGPILGVILGPPILGYLALIWSPEWDLAQMAQKGVPKWTPKMAQKWVILGAKKRPKKPIAIVAKAQNLHYSTRLFLTIFPGFWPLFDPLGGRFGQKSILEQRAGQNGPLEGGQKVTFPMK